MRDTRPFFPPPSRHRASLRGHGSLGSAIRHTSTPIFNPTRPSTWVVYAAVSASTPRTDHASTCGRNSDHNPCEQHSASARRLCWVSVPPQSSPLTFLPPAVRVPGGLVSWRARMGEHPYGSPRWRLPPMRSPQSTALLLILAGSGCGGRLRSRRPCDWHCRTQVGLRLHGTCRLAASGLTTVAAALTSPRAAIC